MVPLCMPNRFRATDSAGFHGNHNKLEEGVGEVNPPQPKLGERVGGVRPPPHPTLLPNSGRAKIIRATESAFFPPDPCSDVVELSESSFGKEVLQSGDPWLVRRAPGCLYTKKNTTK